jgi:hypothetical protein
MLFSPPALETELRLFLQDRQLLGWGQPHREQFRWKQSDRAAF